MYIYICIYIWPWKLYFLESTLSGGFWKKQKMGAYFGCGFSPTTHTTTQPHFLSFLKERERDVPARGACVCEREHEPMLPLLRIGDSSLLKNHNEWHSSYGENLETKFLGGFALKRFLNHFNARPNQLFCVYCDLYGTKTQCKNCKI